jgi:Transposase
LHSPKEWADLDRGEATSQVKVGIETEGPWVQAMVAAGFQVCPTNPVLVARYRERHSTSGAKSDAGDAQVLAEMVRLDSEHDRVAGDSDTADANETDRPHPPAADLGMHPSDADDYCTARVLGAAVRTGRAVVVARNGRT